ncbi:MAG: hypothetical protein HOB18_14485 [Nitrospina sp.]|jgi:hypothetical protein|nr:hypothetical protein [Nitrospina sp.]
MFLAKKKLFTFPDNLEGVASLNEGQYTAEEYQRLTDDGQINLFESKNAVIAHYLKGNYLKWSSLNFLVDYLRGKCQFKSLISFGSGYCVLEYFLSRYLEGKIYICATDKSEFFVKNAKQIFPEISVQGYDFTKDSLSSMMENGQAPFDVGVAFGSFYVMDDEVFVEVLKSLKESGLQELIDFHSGCMNSMQVLSSIPFFEKLKSVNMVRRFFGKEAVSSEGQFHGYSRSRASLRKIYRKSGWKVVQELSDKSYEYIAILQ